MKNMKPLGNRVLVKKEKPAPLKNGLYLPDSVGDKQRKGVVVAIGTGKRDENGKLIPLHLKVDDRVLMGPYGGMDIKDEGDELILLSEDEVFSILQPEEQS